MYDGRDESEYIVAYLVVMPKIAKFPIEQNDLTAFSLQEIVCDLSICGCLIHSLFDRMLIW